MIGVRTAVSAVLVVAIACWSVCGSAAQGRRVVDLVNVSDPTSERTHGLLGEATTVTDVAGRLGRQATGWFSYDLKIYDDSALSLTCVVRGGSGTRQAFDILVDGRKVATRVVEPSAGGPIEMTVAVPEALSLGKISVTVRFQAQRGSVTPALLELRTVQEHLE
jgi:hypothetical protein